MLPNSFVCFCILLTGAVTCKLTSIKLVGKEVDALSTDKDVAFLTQSILKCTEVGSNQDCTEVAKINGSSELKEVINQQTRKEDSVVYRKFITPKSERKVVFQLL